MDDTSAASPASAASSAAPSPPASAARASPRTPSPVALRILVFVGGAVLMALEIAGSRLLAPHFGNSIFVWGSLISIFLGALSLGYALGGWAADRWPSLAALSGVILGSALLILALPALASPVCAFVVREVPTLRFGPLVASLALFALPSILLGAVSPWAVRLAARDVGGIGGVAGRLYALSTLGSIAGTLGTTFVLIPMLDVPTILRLLGGTLAAGPVLVLIAGGRTAVLAAIGGSAALALSQVPAARTSDVRHEGRGMLATHDDTIVLEEDSAYHHIAVVECPPWRSRYLKFDRFVESGISIEPPYASACEYTDMFFLAPIWVPAMRHALFVGGGGGIGPRTFRQLFPGLERIDLVDIDPRVIALSQEHFYFREDGVVHAYAADGRMFVRTAASESYDLIVLDAFTIGGRIPFHLVTREFFLEVRDRLAPGGVLLINTNGAIAGEKSRIVRAVARTVRTVYPTLYAFPMRRPVFAEDDPSWQTETQNVILVATAEDEPISRNAMLDRAIALDRELARRTARRRGAPATEPSLRDLLPRIGVRGLVSYLHEERLPEEDVPLLTDDYAPIEDMEF